MICRLCGKDTKLIKAHAIPEAFFRVLRRGGETPILISNTRDSVRKRSPIGVYDRQILCTDCEATFGPVDTYGILVLVREIDNWFRPVHDAGQTIAFTSDQVDQQKLKMFVLSVLWRAAVSGQAFYRRVDLGPYEETLRRVILRGDSPDIDEFSVILSKWIASAERSFLVDALMSPYREKWDGINAIRLYLGWVVAYVKVDNRPFPDYFRQTALGRLDDTVAIAREFDDSKDLDVMRKVAKVAARGA